MVESKQSKAFTDFKAQALSYFDMQHKDIPEEKEYYTNDQMLNRFLIAREFKIDKTFEMWKKWIFWRKVFQPHKISESEKCIEHLMQTGKLKWYGKDKQNHPSLQYRMRFHVKGDQTLEQHLRYLLFMIEKGCNEADKLGSGQICIVFDRRGYNKKNYDPQSVKAMKLFTPILQDYYPERLHCFYVLGANWFYKAMFSIVKLFLNKRTQEKVKILDNELDLLTYFDKNNIINDYLGSGKNIDNEEKDLEDENELKKLQEQLMKDADLQNQQQQQ